MKKLLSMLFAVTLLIGCTATPEVKPIAEPSDPTKLLVRPPAAAMMPAHEPIPLKKGDDKAGNISIMRENNMLCVDDRAKLTTLQKYILGIFPAEK